MHLALNTVDGPSWKPLPVLFTAPFSLFGDDAAPALWLLVARGGSLGALLVTPWESPSLVERFRCTG